MRIGQDNIRIAVLCEFEEVGIGGERRFKQLVILDAG